MDSATLLSSPGVLAATGNPGKLAGLSSMLLLKLRSPQTGLPLDICPILHCLQPINPNSSNKVVSERTTWGLRPRGTEITFPIVDNIPMLLPVAAQHNIRIPEGRDASCDVSVVIMTWNEEGNIGTVVSEVKREMTDSNLSFEIIVLDGGSTDSTVRVAAAAGARVISQKDKGYAAGLRQAFCSTNGEFVITLDGDCSHPASSIPLLLKERETAQIIVASRYGANGTFTGPFIRYLLSRLLNSVFRRILALPISDLSSGYRLYRRTVLGPQEYRSRDFSILEEILICAFADGFAVREIPLHYRPRENGTSHARLFAFAISYLRTLWRMVLIRYGADASDYDSRAFDSMNLIQRWWQRKRLRNVFALLGKYRHSGDVLDIGCGSSRIIQSLPHAVAMDLSLKKLRFLSATNFRRVCGSALELPFADESFDCAIHSQLLQYLPDEQRAFREVARVLRPGGTLIAGTVDNESWSWRLIRKLYSLLMLHAYRSPPPSRRSAAWLREQLFRHNFQILDTRNILRAEIIIKAMKASNTLCQPENR